MGPAARSGGAPRANGVHRLAVVPLEGRVPRARLSRRRTPAPPVALHHLHRKQMNIVTVRKAVLGRHLFTHAFALQEIFSLKKTLLAIFAQFTFQFIMPYYCVII